MLMLITLTVTDDRIMRPAGHTMAITRMRKRKKLGQGC